MRLTKVESSNVAAVGYLDQEQVLLVRYHDGALYAGLGVTVERFAKLMASQSKGGFLAKMQETVVLVQKGGAYTAPGNAGGVAETALADNPSIAHVTTTAGAEKERRTPQLTLEQIRQAQTAPARDSSFSILARK